MPARPIPEEEGDEFHFAELPELGELELAGRQLDEAQTLLVELELVKVTIKAQEEREEEIKLALEKLQQRAHTPGMRYGKLCFAARPHKGRRMLDESLLMMNGVRRETIDDSYTFAKPYVARDFRVLK